MSGALGWLPLALSFVALLGAAHAATFAATTGWYAKTANLWRIDPATARQREATKPWWVRYTDRLIRP